MPVFVVKDGLGARVVLTGQVVGDARQFHADAGRLRGGVQREVPERARTQRGQGVDQSRVAQGDDRLRQRAGLGMAATRMVFSTIQRLKPTVLARAARAAA